jgi:AraC-like DNA-binding protein
MLQGLAGPTMPRAVSEIAGPERAAGWYGDARTGDGPAAVAPRPPGRSPRALDARAPATAHYLLVQLSDTGLRPRFAETCKAFGEIVWCDDLDELVRRAGAREALAVVVDATDQLGTPTGGAIAVMRRRRPDLPLVLWCDRNAAGPSLLAATAAGVSAVVFRDDLDLEHRLLGALTRATDVTFQQLIDQALARRVPSALVPAVRFCLDRGGATPTVEAVAATVGVPSRRLADELRSAGLPPLAALVTWSRLLTAAYRLEHSRESVGAIARAVGLASGSALGHLLRRYVNESAGGLRAPGGFGWVLRCFERYLVKRR